MNTVRIGVIGCGGIANSVHLPSLQKIGEAFISAICDIDPVRLHETGEKFCVPVERRFQDYHDLIACTDVDAVDICTPNSSHVPIAMAALSAGKPVCIEKPVGVSYREAADLQDKAKQAGLPVMVCFSYRFMPAVRYARDIIQSGKIGKVVHVYAQYLKASALMSGRRLDWRFERQIARYGVSGDLAVHIIDMIRFLVTDFRAVCAQTGIVVSQRFRLDRDEWAAVDTDDYCHFLAELDSGIPAVFAISRCAAGNRNHISVDIYGDQGALRFDLNKKDTLQFCANDETGGDAVFETIVVPDIHPGQMNAFIELVGGKTDPLTPLLTDGVACQKILDALLESADGQKWIFM